MRRVALTASALTTLALTIAVTAVLDSPAHAARREITWWVGTEYSWSQMRGMFQRKNPGVDVAMVVGDMDKFYTMTTAGLMPDVWGPWETPGIHADANRNWATPLDAYIKRDSKELDIADFFPGVMRQFEVAGKQRSLPISPYADYCLYNKQPYAQAGLAAPPVDAGDRGWSWAQMVANAQKCTVRDASG